jgi:hypothetical protein
MSTAIEPEPLKGDESSGRLMRFTVRVVAATLVITGLVAWLLATHTSVPVAGSSGRAVSRSGSTTLFYHATN